jgi:hypothetical protein
MYMLRDDGFRNVANVTLTTLEHCHLAGIKVKACHRKSVAGEQEREGQADVAQPDDAHLAVFASTLDWKLASASHVTTVPLFTFMVSSTCIA